MFQQMTAFLDTMDRLCAIASRCQLPQDDVEFLYNLAGRTTQPEFVDLYMRAAGARGQRNNNTPGQQIVRPQGNSPGLLGRAENILCHPVTALAMAGLAVRFPQARPAIAMMAAYCAGNADIGQLQRELSRIPELLGGNTSPMPQLGAPAALLLAASRAADVAAGRAASPAADSIVRAIRDQQSASALLGRNDLATMPLPPLGQGWDAAVNWARLEALTRGTRDAAVALAGSPAANSVMRVVDVADLSATLVDQVGT